MQERPCPFMRMIFVCLEEGADGCGGAQALAVADALKRGVRERGMRDQIKVTKSPCLGICEGGPNVIVYPEGTLISGVTPEDVPALLERFAKAKETK